MEVVFRVDASSQIGTGHVMRCLALADELKSNDNNISFVCRNNAGHLINFINNKGYRVYVIPVEEYSANQNDYKDGQNIDLMIDASQTIEVLQQVNVDWLIVDHYAINYKWESELKKYVKSILVIDDLANRRHDCDVLLDQNWFGAETIVRYKNLLPKDCVTLLGPNFAILSKKYSIARRQKELHNGNINNVLIFMGGVDSGEQTAKALEALCCEELKHISVDVVIGHSNKDVNKIIKIASNRKRTIIHKLLPSLVDLMKRADLMLCAGGSTTWERCCLGLPAIVVTSAKNQVKFTKLLAKEGVHLLLGSSNEINSQDWFLKICELTNDRDRVKKMSSLSSTMVDGEGVSRVVSKLHRFCMPISIRKATHEDEKLMLDWVNDPIVRKFSFNQEHITNEEHHDWFKKKINDPDCLILIGIDSVNIPIGQVRIDSLDEIGIIDISIDSAARGFGFAETLLKKSVEFWKNTGSNKPLIGDVLRSNIASQKVFINSGFIEQNNDDPNNGNVIRYILD